MKEGKFKGQYKGKRTSKTLRNMKSTFVSSLYKDINLMKEIHQLKKEMRKEVKINLSRECKDWTASLNIKMKKLKKEMKRIRK